MSSTLYQNVREALDSLLASSELSKSARESGTELLAKVEAIWQACNPIPRPNDASQSPSGKGESSKSVDSANEKRLEMIRAVMELVGRDVVVSPLTDGTLPEPAVEDEAARGRFLDALSYRLDVILTLYEVVFASAPQAVPLEPGALFIPLLEDLVELLSVEIWRDLWGYIETRSKRFTKDMPASRGKALPLLRILNSFLRFLPRTPEDLVFRGRIHQFAGSVISVADKSAVNMRGDYNDISTTWEEDEPAAEGKKEIGGDVDMEQKEKDDKDKAEDKKDAEPDFYSTLWSLQQYFSNPPSLDGPPTGSPPITPFAQFKQKTDFVLPKLFEQTQKEKATAGVESTPPSATSGPQSPLSRKRKRTTSDNANSNGTTFFHPRYLTGRRLLAHELADPAFRRQVLVQYFILFQFLLNLTPGSAAKQAFTGGMPKTFVVGPEDQEWVRKKIGGIMEEMRKMGKDGKGFGNTVRSVIAKETHYAQWKNDGCPETVFDVLPLNDDSAAQAAEGWKRHCGPPPRLQFKLGSRPLTALWRNGFESIEQLKGWKRSSTVDGLEEELKALEEGIEDDKAMGKEPSAEEQAAFDELRIKNTWRGLRLASHTNLRHFVSVNEKRDLHKLVASLKNGLDKTARSTPRPGGRGGTETEDEVALGKDLEVADGKKENGNGHAGNGMEVDGEGEGDRKVEDGIKTPERPAVLDVEMAAS